MSRNRREMFAELLAEIRLAIEAGCEAFDLLKGDYQYKYRFGAHPRAVKRLIATRRGLGRG